MKQITRKLVLAAASVASSVSAFAQITNIENGMDDATTILKRIGNKSSSLVGVGIGLVGMAYIVINLVKFFKKEPDSDSALLKVGIGLLLAGVLLAVVPAVFFKGI